MDGLSGVDEAQQVSDAGLAVVHDLLISAELALNAAWGMVSQVLDEHVVEFLICRRPLPRECLRGSMVT